MEAKFAQGLQFPSWVDSERTVKRQIGSVGFYRGLRDPQKHRILNLAHLKYCEKLSKGRRRTVSLEVSCCCENSPVSILETGKFQAPFDEGVILQNTSEEIKPYLNGRCIYLVGMMGSGKTTVGKIMSEVLGYSFFDSDALVEQEAGGSVADIFKLYGEDYFRDRETEVLKKLSLMHRLIVSTGGGAVMRPINWKYIHKGISAWLDVPVEALAQRIAAMGTNSRPLLHYESGDEYTKAFMRLSALFEERGEAYANANTRVSLENVAAKLGCKEVSDLSPTTIAIEVLHHIGSYLKNGDGHTEGGL